MCTKLTQHMDSAKKAIETGDYFDFAENIISALHLSKNAKTVQILYVQGLMEFGDCKRVFKVIENLLQKPTLSNEERWELSERKAILFWKIKDFKAAKLIYEELCKSNIIGVQIKGYGNLAPMYIDQYIYEGKFDKKLLNEAVVNSSKALALISVHDSQEMYEKILFNLWTAHWYNKNFSEALSVIKQVLQLSEGKNYRALIGMAETCITLNDYNSAMEYLERAEKLSLFDSYYQGYIKLVQAIIFNECQDFSQARECLMIAYDNYIQAGAFYEAGYCLQYIIALDYIVNSEAIGFMISKLTSPMANIYDLKGIQPLKV